MAINTLLVLGFQNSIVDTIQTVYESPESGDGTEIRQFTATNNTVSNKTYMAYIYNALGALVEAVVPRTIVVKQ